MERDWLLFNDGEKRAAIDGDTLVGKDGQSFRVRGIDTYETPHSEDDMFGTNQGLVQKDIFSKLISEKGFNYLEFLGATAASQKLYSGEKTKRELVDVKNSDGITAASKMYYEGLATPRGRNVSASDVQVWKQGIAARNRNPNNQDPYYEQLRQDLANASKLDIRFRKQNAITERDYNPKVHSGVDFRHQDRSIYNEADSPFLASLSGGLDGMQAGMYGVLEMLGDRTSWEALERFGKDGVQMQAEQQNRLPFWITNIDDIDSIGDFGDWAAGALGGSLPYFGLMAAGFIPGMQPPVFASMSLIYAGQTWNAMEGLPDEKSAGIALTAGILQASFERLGGYAIFRLVKPADLGTKKGINKAIDEIVKSGRKSSVTGKILTRKEASDIIAASKRDEIIKVLKDFKQNSAVWSAYSQQVAIKAGAGMIGEGTTEGMQEATQYIGAYLGSPESKRKFNMQDVKRKDGTVVEAGFVSIIKNAVAAGALLGGGISGSKALLTEKQPYSTSVRQSIYQEGTNTTVDTSPVKDINDVVEEMSTRHLDPSDTFNSPTAPTTTQENQTFEEETVEEIANETIPASILDPELEKRVVDNAVETQKNIIGVTRGSVSNDKLEAIEENFGKEYVGVYLKAIFKQAQENLKNSTRSKADKKRYKKALDDQLESTLKDYYGQDYEVEQDKKQVAKDTKIKKGWNQLGNPTAPNFQGPKNPNEQTVVRTSAGGTDRDRVRSKNEQNAEDVKGFISLYSTARDAMAGTSKAAKFLLKGEWISAPMQVLAMELGDIWNNLDTLRAEGEYIGSPFGRFFAGKTMVQERRDIEGEAHVWLADILNTVIASLRTNGMPLKTNPKNRRKVWDMLGEYAYTKELKKGQEGLAVPFGIALGEINAYELEQEVIIRSVDKNYTRPDTERILVTKPDGTQVWERFSLGVFFNKKLSSEKVTENKEAYIKTVMDVHRWTREEAELEYNKIAGTPNGWNYQEWADTKFLTKKPSYLKTRVSYTDPAFEKLWEKNDYDSALTRATEVAHYVSDMRSKGFGGAKLNSKILSIRDELFQKYGQAGVDEYMPRIAFEIYRHYEMHMGEYHKIQSESGRAMAAHLGSMLSFAYMAMAIIASIPEIALMFRDMSGLTVNGERMFVKATKNLAKLTKQSMIGQMKKIHHFEGDWANTDYRDKHLNRQIARGMTGKEYTAGHIVDAEYGMDRKHWMQAKAMPMFYKWTGLTPYTTWVRMGRDSFADDWLAVQMADTTEMISEVLIKFEEDYKLNNPKFTEEENEGKSIEQIAKEDAAYETKLIKRINKLTSPDDYDGVVELQQLVHAFSLNNKQAQAFKKLRNAGVDPVGLSSAHLQLEDWFISAKRAYFEPGATGVGKYSGVSLTDADPIITQARGLITFDKWLDALRVHPSSKLKHIKDVGARVARTLDTARSNFVDQALVNPDPGKRPPMYSDGRTRLLFMFQGYLAQFSSKIARPILRDLAGKGSPQDQINAAAVMMGALALAFLGQAFKDEIKYGEKPAWLTDAEYIQRGIMASGLMGQTERIFNFIFPLYTSEEDNLADKFWAEFGPLTGTIDSIAKGTKWAAEGEGERALNQLLKVAPAGSFTQQRQFMAKLLAGNLNDGE